MAHIKKVTINKVGTYARISRKTVDGKYLGFRSYHLTDKQAQRLFDATQNMVSRIKPWGSVEYKSNEMRVK